MTMTSDQFRALAAQGYYRIPVMRDVLADLDTPLSSYLKLADGPYSYLLESVQGGEKWGRYSIIGLPCRQRIEVRGTELRVYHAAAVHEQVTVSDPLAWIEEFHASQRVPELPGLPRFTGGLVGYFGYDTVRYIEPRLAPCPTADSLNTPDFLLLVSDEVVGFDNLRGKLYVVVHVDPALDAAHDEAQARLEVLVQRMQQAAMLYGRGTSASKVHAEADFVSGFTRTGFEAAVERVKEYIIDGDVMQVVLSQRLSIPFAAAPLDLYRALRSLNPSPYLIYFNLADFTSSVRRRRFSCTSSTAWSRCGRSPARVNAAPTRQKTAHSSRTCSPIPRSALSI